MLKTNKQTKTATLIGYSCLDLESVTYLYKKEEILSSTGYFKNPCVGMTW